MKKLLATLMSVLLIFSMLNFTACGGTSSSESSSESSSATTTDTTSNTSSEEEEEDDYVSLKLCTTTGDMGYATDEENIRGLYEAGFRYIDFSMYSFTADCIYMQDGWRDEALRLKGVADELGMEFVQAHSQGGNPLSTNATEVDFLVATTIRSIEICEVLGIENTVVHAGWRGGLSKYEWFEANKEFYERLLPTAERCGVNVLCENSTAKNMGSNYYINTGADMREFIDYVDHPNFHGCWDTGHAHCEGGSQYDDIMALGEEMYAIHYADNDGSGDQHLMVYGGTLNHGDVMMALKHVGFKGYFTFECDGSNRMMKGYNGPTLPVMQEGGISDPRYFNRARQEKLLYQAGEYLLAFYGL